MKKEDIKSWVIAYGGTVNKAKVLERLAEIAPRVAQWHEDYYASPHWCGESKPRSPEERKKLFGPFGFNVVGGVKYLKLAGGSGIFCFIGAEDGAIYKAAGYNKPAKGPRGNIFVDADVERCMANPHGSGFYAR